MANEFIARKGLIIYGSTGSTLSNTTLIIDDDGVVKNSLVNDLQVFNSVSGLTSSLSNSLSTISTDVNSKENTINKQNSLATDGTGIKFPTVDAINNANFISNNNVSNILKEEFTYISGTQSFTLAATHSQVYMVSVQGQGALSTSQYTITAPNKVTILDTLDTNDYVTILYSTAPVAVQPYYTQSQSDSIYVPKATTIAINGVTQSLNTNISFTISKRTFNIDYYLGGAMNASTSWYARASLSAFGTFTVNATLTPSNQFADITYQAPSHVIPFQSKLKSITIRGWSNGSGNPVRLCVVKSNNVTGSSVAVGIVSPLIIADITFTTNSNSFKHFFNSTGLDLTTVLAQLTEIRIVMFNNNAGGTPLQDTFINLEFEES